MHKISQILTYLNNIGLNTHKEIYMLNFIKKLFGSNAPESAPAPYKVEAPEIKKGPEFHEEIRQQVEAEKSFPVKETKPAVKAKSKKAPAKATAKKAPAPKKSKKQ
jgi:hypothetical protein